MLFRSAIKSSFLAPSFVPISAIARKRTIFYSFLQNIFETFSKILSHDGERVVGESCVMQYSFFLPIFFDPRPRVSRRRYFKDFPVKGFPIT